MSHKKESYCIPLQSLQEGVHEMLFKINKEFVEEQEIEGMSDAKIAVKAVFTKRPQVHTLELTLKGSVEVSCDRCLDPLNISIQNHQTFIVKVGVSNDDFSDSEDVILIAEDDVEIELSHIFYESILLSLPMKRMHDEKKCNATMLSFLEKNESVEKKEKTDPRWDTLKNIFEN